MLHIPDNYASIPVAIYYGDINHGYGPSKESTIGPYNKAHLTLEDIRCKVVQIYAKFLPIDEKHVIDKIHAIPLMH